MAYDVPSQAGNTSKYLKTNGSSTLWDSPLATEFGLFSVKNPAYGATGDGTTDDGPAIQLAFNAAKAAGGIVYFPAVASPATQGYKIVTPVTLTWPQNVGINFGILGCGDSSPIIIACGTGVDAFTLTFSAGEWVTAWSRDMTFRTSHLSSDGSTKDCAAIYAVAMSSSETFGMFGMHKAVGVASSGLGLFHFSGGGGKASIDYLHNAGCYCGSGGAPVWGFVYFDQFGGASCLGWSSFGEYDWFGNDNNVSGLGSCDAFWRCLPNRNASWGPSTFLLANGLTSTRDTSTWYSFQTSGVLRVASLIFDNIQFNIGSGVAINCYDVEKLEVRGAVWKGAGSVYLVDGYQFGHVEIHNVTTATGSTVPKINTDATGTIDVYDTIVGAVVGDTNGGVRQLRSGMGGGANGAALTIGSNTIAPTRPIHSVGAGLIKTITLPYAAFVGSVILRPTAAFTYDATGNVLGTGTAVVGRDMTATYDGTAWAMSY